MSLQFNAANQQGTEKELFDKIEKINALDDESISQLLSTNPEEAEIFLTFAKELADAQGFGKTADTAAKTQLAKQTAGFQNYTKCSVVVPKDNDIPDKYGYDNIESDLQEVYLTHLLQEMFNANMFRDGTYVDITAAEHRTTVTCKDGLYYFYDSNNVELLQTECQNLAELAEQILDSYYSVMQAIINTNVSEEHNYIINFEGIQHESNKTYLDSPSLFSEMLRMQQADGINMEQNTAIGETLLLSACEYSEAVGVSDLLKLHVGHISHHTGFYPLHRAVFDNNIDILNYFIASDVDLLVTDKDGMTALHIAAGCGFSEACLRLLEKAPETNRPDSAGYYPLHFAAQNNKTSAIAMLLAYAPSTTNITESNGRTALQIAAYSGSSDAVEILLNTIDNIDHQDNAGATALHLAATYNETACIDRLLRHNADPTIKNQDDLTAIHIAAKKGNDNTLIKFGQLAPGCIDSNGGQYQQTPLFNAVIAKNLASADILLSYGANPNHEDAKGFTPVVYAVAAKNKNMVDCLVLHGAQINDSIKNKVYDNLDAAKGLLKKMQRAIRYLESAPTIKLSKAACRRPLAYINTLLEPSSSLNEIMTKHLGTEQVHNLERQVVGHVNRNTILQAIVNEGHFENIKDIASPSLGFR